MRWALLKRSLELHTISALANSARAMESQIMAESSLLGTIWAMAEARWASDLCGWLR